jgi:hypothetical protein
MKPLLFFLLFSFGAWCGGQELSLNYPLSNKLSEGGWQIVALDNGDFLIAGQARCKESALFDICLCLLRVNGAGEKIWGHLFDGAPDINLNPAGRTLVVRNDTIFIANEIWKSGQKEMRMLALNLEGDLVFTKDLGFAGAQSWNLRAMIKTGPHFLVYGDAVFSGQGNRIFFRTLDDQFNEINIQLIGDGQSKRLMELGERAAGGFVLAHEQGNWPSLVLTQLDETLHESASETLLQSAQGLASVNIFETENNSFLLTWQKDLSFSLLDTFPYPSAVYKFDSLFQMEWEYIFAHKSEKSHISAIKTSDGNLLGMGATDYFGNQNIYPNRWADAWIFLISPSGDLLWERNIADIRESFGGRLWHAVETADGFVFTGDIDKVNPEGTPFFNDPDIWLLTLDKNGCWNGNCNQNIIITGDSTSITTHTRSVAVSDPATRIFPNPSQGSLTLARDNPGGMERLSIRVFDVLGKQVAGFALQAPQSTIDLNHLPAGLYQVAVYANGSLIDTHKLIVQY